MSDSESHKVQFHGSPAPTSVANLPGDTGSSHCRRSPDSPPAAMVGCASPLAVDHSLEELAQWPEQQPTLGERTFFSSLCSVAQGLLLLIPVMFVAQCFIVLALRGQPTLNNLHGRRVEAAAKLGPTVFPIVFAAIVSRSLKYACRYLCQRGTTLGTLESLLASRSFWSTLECQLLLRRLTALGVPLILLWSLSPLGGQASLRVLERFDHSSQSNTTLRYLLTGHTSVVNFSNGSGTAKNDQIFISALTASKETKRAPRDNWGNVRVPQLEMLLQPGSNGTAAWLPVPDIALPEAYSSLIGIPIAGLPPNFAASFTIETSYMSLACSPWSGYRRYLDWARNATSLWNVTTASPNDTMRPFRNGIAPGQRRVLSTTFFLDTDLAPRRSDEARTLFFGSLAVKGVSQFTIQTANVTRCAVSETHVEVHVECQARSSSGSSSSSSSNNCRATKMRRSLADTRPSALTPLDEAPIAKLLFHHLPLVAPGVNDGTTLTMRFLNDTTQLAVDGPEREQFVDPTHLAPLPLSRRLTLLLNTYHHAFLVRDLGILFGEAPGDTARYGHDFNRPLAEPLLTHLDSAHWAALCPVFCSRSATATLTGVEQRYRANYVWLSLLFCCSAVLLASGVAGLVLSARTLVPDMLGYAASMTYNNPYCPLPDYGGVVDAMDRARTLSKVRFSVADVCGADDVGRIAFTSQNQVERLRKGRKYT